MFVLGRERANQTVVEEPKQWKNKPPLTCEEGHVGMFGVVRAPGHAADGVAQHLQGIALSAKNTSMITSPF